MSAADRTRSRQTARCGTRLRPTCRQSLWPGTAPSRENANSIRDADVIEAVTQKNCAITQMKSSDLRPVLAHRLAQIHVTRKPRFAMPPSVLGMANVTATSRMNPKTTDATTDMYIPTAADARGLVRLLGHVRGRVEPVIVYCAISRPVRKT